MVYQSAAWSAGEASAQAATPVVGERARRVDLAVLGQGHDARGGLGQAHAVIIGRSIRRG